MAVPDRNVRAAAGWILAALGLATAAPPALSQPQVVSGVSAEQLFALAGELEGGDQQDEAERIYDALEGDIHIEIRNEARFRHAQLLIARQALEEAAAHYRAILAEQPDTQRVRLELAALLARAGDLSGARRELETAQADGLPPEVARLVDQYAAALRSREPYGASFEFALAPSNNINRATTATTLDTVLAPFQLSEDARAKSGVGVRLGAQAYYRVPVLEKSQLTFRVAGQGNFYRSASFNDVVGSVQVGLETGIANMKVRPFIGRSYRWFGGDFYAATDTVTVEVQSPLGPDAQLTTDIGLGRADYQLNDLQDGNIYSADVLYERAFSQDAGGGVGLSFQRQGARDPGYSTTSGGIRFLLWQRFGEVSTFADMRVSKLDADERLTLFPDRREDWQYSASVGAIFPQLKLYGFAPVLKLSLERNESTLGVYDYSRVSGDVGFTRAF